MSIRALVWGEYIHERSDAAVAAIYPHGMHSVIASALAEDAGIVADTATLSDPQHGLTAERLARTDVLFWWGHKAHGDVDDVVVDRVQARGWEGMGLVVLHSGHYSKIFKRLMGAPCSLKWREAGERERVWVINPNHPIAEGLGPSFEIENTEMYGEPFSIPEPLETVFISWYQGGEVLRSGATFGRGELGAFRRSRASRMQRRADLPSRSRTAEDTRSLFRAIQPRGSVGRLDQ